MTGPRRNGPSREDVSLFDEAPTRPRCWCVYTMADNRRQVLVPVTMFVVFLVGVLGWRAVWPDVPGAGLVMSLFAAGSGIAVGEWAVRSVRCAACKRRRQPHNKMMTRAEPTRSRSAFDHSRGRYDIARYVDTYYTKPLQADLQLLTHLAELHRESPIGGSMIEVGCGPNLFPLMAAAPWRERIHVTDIAPGPLAYVRQQINGGLQAPVWQRFQQRLAAVDSDAYGDAFAVASRLQDICSFECLAVNELPESVWDHCSCHFVLHALSEREGSFSAGARQVVRCVVPGGTFAVSVMLDSTSYVLDGVRHECEPVTSPMVEAALGSEASDLSCWMFDDVIREGHSGMMLAIGSR